MFDSYENLIFFISLALLVDFKFLIFEFGCIPNHQIEFHFITILNLGSILYCDLAIIHKSNKYL
jgi:hypothetical protein